MGSENAAPSGRIEPLVGRICRRDGEKPCYLEFAGVRIEIGIGELRHLLNCAAIELGDASGPLRRVLEEPVRLLVEACEIATTLAIAPSVEDADANRERWELTGVGGVTDLEELRDRVAQWRDRLRGNSMAEFRAIQNESNGRL